MTGAHDGAADEVSLDGLGAIGVAPGLDLVVARPGLRPSPVVRLALHPGDRPLVSAGDAVLPGTPLAERVRDVHQVITDLPGRTTADASGASGGSGASGASGASGLPKDGSERGAGPSSAAAGLTTTASPDAVPASPAIGRWWVGGEETAGFLPGRRRTRRMPGELLYETGGRWRIATGEQHERIESPVAGIVRDARPGIAIAIEAMGAALPAAIATGDATRGRLELAAGADGELRAAGLDVGRTGSILVVGSRVDAETVTRARAMGIRGVIAGGVSSRDLRDLAASERRQRAGLQAAAPFGVLALDGHVRRRIAGPVMAILVALAGHEVALSIDPPALVFDPEGLALPATPPGWVRVRHGEWAGREGLWLGPAGLRRFRGGAQLETGLVRFDSATVAVPLANLERFA